ncbi:MAG: hypothetical protein OEY33_09555, partial [Bdellovibrionales bacterium]|nr:hypothetical protein [Bdellovibrionales bacterium]
GFDFRKEENEIVNIEALLKNVSQGNEQIPLPVTILFLMLTPAIISVSILGMVKNLERESDLEILFEEEFPQEAPISLDEYRKSKQKEEDFRKAG